MNYFKKIDMLEKDLKEIKDNYFKLLNEYTEVSKRVYSMPLYRKLHDKFYKKYNVIQTSVIDDYNVSIKYMRADTYLKFDDEFFVVISSNSLKTVLLISRKDIEIRKNFINLNAQEIKNIINKFLELNTQIQNDTSLKDELLRILN